MGRSVPLLEQSKAVITTNVPTTLTTVYTNTTGTGAELRAVNINGVGDNTVFNTSTGSSEWTFFGSNVNPYIQSAAANSTGFGVPYPVQLSDNRVLLFFLPHFQHRGGTFDYFGGQLIHSQIVEYQTNKYVAGPIVNHNLPTASFNSATYSLWSQPSGMAGSYGPADFKAVALSPTKVVAAYRTGTAFRLMRFTITGNNVDQAIVDLDLTGASYFNTTTAGAFALDSVPGNANKVIVGGFATTNWSIQAINVPDIGAMSAATALTSTGIASSTYHFGISKMVKTATANITPYIIAGATAATTGQAIIFNFNDSLNTFSASGTVQNLTAATSAWAGMDCACMSNGTSVNAVIAMTYTGVTNTIYFARQTSSAGASVTQTTTTLQSSVVRNIAEHFQWGDERVVFVGDGQLLVVYDSAGTATNLIPNTESTDTNRVQQQWIPFNSRPLYTVYDPATILAERVSQYLARESMTSATSVGTRQDRGNYFPWGYNYGGGFAWNEPANCWIVAQNGRLYALDTSGVIQSEISIYDLSTSMNYQYRVSQVQVLPSGRIAFCAEYRVGVFASSYNCWNTWNNFSDSSLLVMLEPVTTPTGLAAARIQAGPSSATGSICMSLVAFIEEIGTTTPTTRTESVYALNMYIGGGSPQGYITTWSASNNTWTSLTTTSIGSTTNGQTWHVGYRIPIKLIQDQPGSLVFTKGWWKLVGAYGFDSAANYQRFGLSVRYQQASFGSFNTQSFLLDNTAGTGYGLSCHTYTSGSRSGIQVAAIYDETQTRPRIFATVNGRAGAFRGVLGPTATGANYRYIQLAVTKFGYTTVLQNTSTGSATGLGYVWNGNNFFTPQATITATSGNGQIIAQPTGKITWSHYGAGLDTVYTVSGVPDDIKFYLLIDDGTSNVFYLNNGQAISVTSLETGLYRSEDIYRIPDGYRLRVRADTPFSLSTLLTIVENS